MPNIFWLASYPKSGNTWVRAVLSVLQGNHEEEVDLNTINTGAIASGREWVENALDFDTDELSDDEIDKLRPYAYDWISGQLEEPGFHKIHDAYTFLPDGTPLIPKSATKGILHIVRNPLDVVPSFANHINKTLDKTIDKMCTSDFAFSENKKRFHSQYRQKLGTWSEHALSWAEVEDVPRLTIRYEDMKLNPVDCFLKIVQFLELPNDIETVRSAVAQCEIQKLQEIESKTGFNERPPSTASFFRKGVVGDWQDKLSDKQIAEIINCNHVAMKRFGYVDSNNQPTPLIRGLV